MPPGYVRVLANAATTVCHDIRGTVKNPGPMSIRVRKFHVACLVLPRPPVQIYDHNYEHNH